MACPCHVCHLMAHVEDDVRRDIQATLSEDLLGLPQGLHQYGPLHIGILANITIQGPITFHYAVNDCPDHVHLRPPKVIEALRRLHIPLVIQCGWVRGGRKPHVYTYTFHLASKARHNNFPVLV